MARKDHDASTNRPPKLLRVGVEDVIDAPLAIEIDGAAFVPRDTLETHVLEQRLERSRIGVSEFHEFEPIGARPDFRR